MSASMRPWRRVLVGAVIASFAIAPASSSAATTQKLSPKAKKAIRAQLKKSVKKNPGVVRRKSFLRKAVLVNFKLPVTIRLRNPCTTENGQNPAPNLSPYVLSQGCHTQGTALNERSIPSATVNLGPSLGTRQIAVGGSLAAVVEFQDSYDGGALGNVNIKLLSSTKKFLSTSSVPLLWNDDIADPAKRNDANFLKATSFETGLSEAGIEQGCSRLRQQLDDDHRRDRSRRLQLAVPRPHADVHSLVGHGRRHPRLPVLRPGGSRRDHDPGRLRAGLPRRGCARSHPDRRRHR